MKPTIGFGNEVARQSDRDRLKAVKEQWKERQRQEKFQIKKSAIIARSVEKLNIVRQKEDAKLEELKTKAEYGFLSKQYTNKPNSYNYKLPKEKKQSTSIRKSKQIGPEYVKGFSKSLKNVAKSFPRQRVPFVMRQPQRPQAPPRRNKLRNFMAHKDASDVYDDDFSTHDGEMLTFFDGDKRAGDDTGALFGL